MKHLRFTLLTLATICFFGTIAAQTYTLTISGRVTDTGNNPVANQAVNVVLDSSFFGFSYMNTVMTNANGDYTDSPSVPTSVTQGTGWTSTQDCNSQWQYNNFTFSQNASVIPNLDFQICTGGGGSCNASFGSGVNGNTVTFTDQSTGSSGITSWSWSFGDGNTSSMQSPTHTYSASGAYNVCLVITTQQGCTDSTCMTVSVGNTLQCQASYYHYPDTNGQYSIILVNTSTGQNPTYFWTFGDGNTSTAAFPQHTYAGPGTYVVCVTLTASGGGQTCTSTYCDSITVTQKVAAPFSINVISPSTSVVEPEPVAFELWPNPSSGMLNATISPAETGMASAVLLDAQGRQAAILMQQEVTAGTQDLRWDVSGLPNGIYFLNLRVGDQQSVRKVLIAK